MINIGDGIVWTYEHTQVEKDLGLDQRNASYYRVHNIKPVSGPDRGIVVLEDIIDGNTDTWLYLQHLEYAIQRENITHIPKKPMEIKQKIERWRLS